MVAVGQRLSLCDHGWREIDGIDTLDPADQAARNITGTGANVKDGARFIRDEIGQEVKDCWWIGQAQRIEFDDALILVPGGVVGCKMSWARQHIHRAPASRLEPLCGRPRLRAKQCRWRISYGLLIQS
jgi:hypothetical protein